MSGTIALRPSFRAIAGVLIVEATLYASDPGHTLLAIAVFVPALTRRVAYSGWDVES